MRAIVLLLLMASMMSTPAWAAIEVRIDAVGLDGYVSNFLPTPVRVHIAAPETQRVELVLLVQSEWAFGARRGVSRTDRFTTQLVVQAGQPIDITVPVLLAWGFSRLDAVITEPNGKHLASQSEDSRSLNLKYHTNVQMQPPLVAIYCTIEKVCQDAQTQITFGGSSEESSKKNKELKFAFLHDLQRSWWAYGAASTLVVAGSIASATGEQKQALEGYLRSGGTLILLQKEAADEGFLAAYRNGEPTGSGVVVGKGRLLRVPSVEDSALRRALTGSQLENVITTLGMPWGAQGRRLLATPFHFPRLRWLVIWLAVYILVIGPMNFLLLRRFRRLEWGWLTVCLVAAGFATALYISSSSNRPKQFQLDDVVIYRMDARSGLASCEFGLRVSSPIRRSVTIAISDDVVLIDTQRFGSSGLPETDIASDITDRPRLQPGWEVQMGPPLSIEFPMLRWSFHDLNAVGLRRFAGSVHWTSPMHLRNETGQSFKQAVYLDYKQNRKYLISGVAAGQEIDLASINSEPIWEEKGGQVQMEDVQLAIEPGRSFSLSGLPYLGVGPARQIFAAVNEGPVLAASLPGLATTRRNLALTLVSLDEP